jgi:hypothetical protein
MNLRSLVARFKRARFKFLIVKPEVLSVMSRLATTESIPSHCFAGTDEEPELLRTCQERDYSVHATLVRM